MLKRQKVLLGLLLKCERKPNKIELMKWLFLLKHETQIVGDTTFYDFVPYKYGPFSFVVYRELEELVNYGYVESEQLSINPQLYENVVELFKALPKIVQNEVKRITSKYGYMSTDQLVKYVYDNYPWFASRSELKQERDVHYTYAHEAIYTAGYEGETIDTFLKKLLSKGIKQIIDVRRNPISRKYGFHKSTLKRLAEKLEIEYHHIPELGIPSEYRTSLNSFNDYQRLLNKYEDEILPKEVNSIDTAKTFMLHQPSALICFESDVRCCHRGRLANKLAQETGLGVINL